MQRFAERRHPLVSSTAVLSLALILAGCNVGPDFLSPRAPDVARFTTTVMPDRTASSPAPTGDAQRFLNGADVPARWWTVFGSPEIDRRIAIALEHNPSITSAQAALRQAQENLNAAAGGQFPQVSGALGASRQKSSLAGVGIENSTAPNPIYTLYNASVSVSYTIDLFGSIRRQVEAQAALADLQQAELDATYQALIANVVTASIQEASLRAQIRATEEIVAAFERQLELIQAQQAFGARSMADVLQARSQLAGQRALLPPLQQRLEQTGNQLATYLGRLPAEADLAPVQLDSLTLPPDIPVSLPSTVVASRPDIRAADAQLHQATARVGVATANRLPNIVLSGSLGSQATSFNDILGAGSGIWSLGLNLTQPIFQGGTLTARQRAAEAALQKAVADYRVTVLTAFQDVANALRALVIDAETLRAQAAFELAAADSLRLVRSQYDAGAINILSVLDAERQMLQSRISLIQARAARLQDTAALYAALGGGWQDAAALAPPLPPPRDRPWLAQ